MAATTVFYWQALCSNGVVVGILPDGFNSYKIQYGDENLGSYGSPEQALDDLVGGHTFSPSDGADTSELGIPDELSDWTQKVYAHIHKTRRT